MKTTSPATVILFTLPFDVWTDHDYEQEAMHHELLMSNWADHASFWGYALDDAERYKEWLAESIAYNSRLEEAAYRAECAAADAADMRRAEAGLPSAEEELEEDIETRAERGFCDAAVDDPVYYGFSFTAADIYTTTLRYGLTRKDGYSSARNRDAALAFEAGFQLGEAQARTLHCKTCKRPWAIKKA